MNYIKAQETIFKSLIRGMQVARFDVDDSHVFITPDGFQGWIFPNDILMVNLEKIPQFSPIDIASLITPANKLQSIPDFRLMSSRSKDLYRKLSNGKKIVWVKDKFLQMFHNPEFYQYLDMPNKHIVVTEKVRGKETPVGIVLPMRIYDEHDM